MQSLPFFIKHQLFSYTCNFTWQKHSVNKTTTLNKHWPCVTHLWSHLRQCQDLLVFLDWAISLTSKVLKLVEIPRSSVRLWHICMRFMDLWFGFRCRWGIPWYSWLRQGKKTNIRYMYKLFSFSSHVLKSWLKGVKCYALHCILLFLFTKL